MKSSKGLVVMVVVIILGLFLVLAEPLMAVNENTVRLGNIAGSAVGTLVKGLIQGNVHSWKDVAKCLAYGSVAGFGFYQAKVLVSKGYVFGGVLTANLAFSVIDNVSNGRNPLSYLHFSLPLVHLQVATPLARNPQAIVRMDISTLDVARLFKAAENMEKVSFRNGLLTFTAKQTYRQGVIGWSSGLFPTVLKDQSEGVYRHEVVHVIQHLQLGSISPEPLIRKGTPSSGKPRLFAFSGIRLQAFDLFDGLAMRNVEVDNKHWKEIEAYHFAF